MSEFPFYEVAHKLNRLVSEYELSRLKSLIPNNLESISFEVRLEYDDQTHYCTVYPEFNFSNREEVDQDILDNILDDFHSFDVDFEVIQRYYGEHIYARDIYSAATDNINLRAIDILLDGVGESMKSLNSHERIAVIEKLHSLAAFA